MHSITHYNSTCSNNSASIGIIAYRFASQIDFLYVHTHYVKTAVISWKSECDIIYRLPQNNNSSVA